MRKWVPELEIEYNPDARQKIADTWPMVKSTILNHFILKSFLKIIYLVWSGKNVLHMK